MIKGLERRVKALIDVPKLGGDEDVLARHFRGAQALAHPRFIYINGCRINMPVAGSECGLNHGSGGVRGRLEDAQTHLGN